MIGRERQTHWRLSGGHGGTIREERWRSIVDAEDIVVSNDGGDNHLLSLHAHSPRGFSWQGEEERGAKMASKTTAMQASR
jgi:hypothetical protein